MQMTNGEIVRSFREAKNPKQQITVLADLNATDKASIAQILYEAGELSAQTVGQYRRGSRKVTKGAVTAPSPPTAEKETEKSIPASVLYLVKQEIQRLQEAYENAKNITTRYEELQAFLESNT